MNGWPHAAGIVLLAFFGASGALALKLSARASVESNLSTTVRPWKWLMPGPFLLGCWPRFHFSFAACAATYATPAIAGSNFLLTAAPLFAHGPILEARRDDHGDADDDGEGHEGTSEEMKGAVVAAPTIERG